MRTIEELNKYNQGNRQLSREEVISEYNTRYKPTPTPATHPELFDPFDPPAGWEYDAYHAFWWKLPTEQQYQAQLWFITLCVLVTTAFVIMSIVYA